MAKKEYHPPRDGFAELYAAVANIEATLEIDESQPRMHDPSSFEGILEGLDTIRLNAVYLMFDRKATAEEVRALEEAAKRMQEELCWREHKQRSNLRRYKST